ncbi:hypothetical protein RG836_19395 [Pseudomonas sp. SZMC_28357]|nr:hypothetical protein [Pseudomonas sp. SZMC_28357]MDR9753618.1 hypothetical protein [Pseudomonas sp. SZMC_28357]
MVKAIKLLDWFGHGLGGVVAVPASSLASQLPQVLWCVQLIETNLV